MARKIIFALFFITLFLIPFITASTTEINVKTKPDHKLLIIAQKAGVFPIVGIESFAPYKPTGTFGVVKISLVTSETKVDLKLDLITSDSAPDMNNLFTDIPTTGEPVFINFLPGNYSYTVGNPVVINETNTTAVNLTSINTTNTTNETPQVSAPEAPIANDSNKTISKSNFSITGYASQFYESNSKTFFYILIVIGIIVGILIVIFIVRKIPKRSSDHYMIRHKPLESASSSANPSLTHAEKKLREAQQEIETIKKRNEAIREAERKLQEDNIRLERLRRGGY